MENNSHEYDDIIDLPRPASSRPKMSMEMRAAQFSPFSALSGFDDAVEETSRRTQAEAPPSAGEPRKEM